MTLPVVYSGLPRNLFMPGFTTSTTCRTWRQSSIFLSNKISGRSSKVYPGALPYSWIRECFKEVMKTLHGCKTDLNFFVSLSISWIFISNSSTFSAWSISLWISLNILSKESALMLNSQCVHFHVASWSEEKHERLWLQTQVNLSLQYKIHK